MDTKSRLRRAAFLGASTVAAAGLALFLILISPLLRIATKLSGIGAFKDQFAPAVKNLHFKGFDVFTIYLKSVVIAIAMANVHAALADASVAGLSAHLDPIDSQAWRRAAGTPLQP